MAFSKYNTPPGQKTIFRCKGPCKRDRGYKAFEYSKGGKAKKRYEICKYCYEDIKKED